MANQVISRLFEGVPRFDLVINPTNIPSQLEKASFSNLSYRRHANKIQYVKTTTGAPIGSPSPNEKCLNTFDNILYEESGGSWDAGTALTDGQTFIFKDDGFITNGDAGDHLANDAVYYYYGTDDVVLNTIGQQNHGDIIFIEEDSQYWKYFNTGWQLLVASNDGDAIVLNSDLIALTGGTTLNASTGTVSPWTDAENQVFTSGTEITIDRTSFSETVAQAGTPVRFSSDGSSWQYAMIVSVTLNMSDIDLVIEGVAMTAPTVAFFQIGSTDQLLTYQINIPGDLSVTDDLVLDVLNTKIRWLYGEAFVVRVAAEVNTAASGADLTINLAKGVDTNDILSSDLDLAQSTDRVSSGTAINTSNYKLAFDDRLFVKVTQVGSTTEGADLSIVIIAVANTFRAETFIPIGAPVAPYAFIMTGATSGTSLSYTTPTNKVASIDYFSMAIDTGGSADRGDDTLERFASAGVFDATRTFGCGGADSGNSNVSVINFINSASTSGDATNRGDISENTQDGRGISGTTYGQICGGKSPSTSSAKTSIFSLFLPSATGDTSDRGDLFESTLRGGSCFGRQLGCIGGGQPTTTSTSPRSTIHVLNVDSSTGGGADRSDLIQSSTALSGVGDRDGLNQGIFMGGDSNGSSTAASSTTDVQTIDLTLTTGNATDRADLAVAKAGMCGNSGDTIGYGSGGNSEDSFVSLDIDKITYTTGTMSVSNRGALSVPTYLASSHM